MSTDLSPARNDDQLPLPPVGTASGRALRLAGGLLLIGAGITLAMFLLGRGPGGGVTETSTSHGPVDRIVFDLRANGSVEVTRHEAAEVLVLERTESTTREIRTSQEVVGDALEVSSERCSRWLTLWFDRCTASFEVRVPEATAVDGSIRHGQVDLRDLGSADLHVGHGSVVAAGLAGPVRLATGHGAVRIDQAATDVAAGTGHGDVTITRARGDVEARTGHGSVAVDDVTGSLDLRTGHGTIEATAGEGPEVRLESGHGDVAFEPAAPPTSASATTSHGDVDVRLPSDAPAYAIATDSGNRAADIDIATDPAADHQMEVRTGHGRIAVGYAAR